MYWRYSTRAAAALSSLRGGIPPLRSAGFAGFLIFIAYESPSDGIRGPMRPAENPICRCAAVKPCFAASGASSMLWRGRRDMRVILFELLISVSTRSLLSNLYVLAILLNRCRQKEDESFAISHGMENYLLRNIACVEVAFFIVLAGI
jgi:hypothetical protein